MSATDNELQVLVQWPGGPPSPWPDPAATGRRSTVDGRETTTVTTISAALPVHAIISSPSEQREGRGEQLAVSHTGA